MNKNGQNDDFELSFKVEKIDPPNKIVAKDIKNVTEKEIIDAFLPKIYEEYDRINPKFKIKDLYGAKNYLQYNYVKIKNINFPIDLSSEKIIDNFSIEGRFIYKPLGFFNAVFELKIPNLKLPAAQIN